MMSMSQAALSTDPISTCSACSIDLEEVASSNSRSTSIGASIWALKSDFELRKKSEAVCRVYELTLLLTVSRIETT